MVVRRNATLAVRHGIENDVQHGAVVPPLYLSTNYSFYDYKTPRECDYSRSGNPTRNIFANALAQLEQGERGIITNSGMAAINLVVNLLSPEDLLIIPHDCYGGSYRLFTHLAQKGHFKLSIVDQTDLQSVDDAIAKNPAMFWIETPSNPLLRIVDIKEIAKKIKQGNTLLVVDNTFLSPILQQPLQLGADIVVHSTTKYINGHSDVVGGAVIAKDAKIGEDLDWWANTLGLSGGAFDSYLSLRGLRTLKVRIKEHQYNAQKIIALLEQSNEVGKIYYPGLASHPNHQIAKNQQSGFGGMVSFELTGDEKSVSAFLDALTLFSLAESLGGIESLVCVPATMTHRAMSPEAQKKAGIKETLIRLSIGIEDSEDLIADIQKGLHAVERICNNKE